MPVPKIDITRPQSARVWNYLLGGKGNYPADRQVGDAIVAELPGIREVARQGRQFLARAVTHLASEAGVDQFLDIGTGLPTMENTHEVAQRVDPRARIVYVDNDDLVLLLGILGRATPVFDDMLAVVHTLTEALPSGSYLVLLDGTDTSAGARTAAPLNNYALRTLDELRKCLDGLELVEPGLVRAAQWRPETDAGTDAVPIGSGLLDSYCAVARKP